MRILVVDDVPVVRNVIAKVFMRAGYQTVEAENGEAAVTVLQHGGIEAVVTDIWMPGGDGLGLIRLIAETYPDIAVVAMSGGSPQMHITDSLESASAAGAPVTVYKPIDKTELLDALSQALKKVGKELKCPN